MHLGRVNVMSSVSSLETVALIMNSGVSKVVTAKATVVDTVLQVTAIVMSSV
jgi:hypothetical protein